MAWTTPKTYTAEVATSSDMNTYVSDNMNALKNGRPGDEWTGTSGTYTTTSTSYVDVDATNLSFTVTTEGGDLLVVFNGRGKINNQTYAISLVVDVDGTDYLCGEFYTAEVDNLSFTRLIPMASAGAKVVKLQWKSNNGAQTATLYQDTLQMAIFEVGTSL